MVTERLLPSRGIVACGGPWRATGEVGICALGITLGLERGGSWTFVFITVVIK